MTEPTKRGINLGCGKVTLPCERPDHHTWLPEFLYTSPDIKWDNADWNAAAGVNMAIDLFDYPWRENEIVLPDNTYDYALASHIVEHIPHHVVERGTFIPHHPDWQDGFFYWFGELNRILKPGGKAYICVPYAWSHSGISDPTHTRYCTPATFNYLVEHESSPFRYRNGARWREINYEEDLTFVPHLQGMAIVQDTMRMLHLQNKLMTHGVINIGKEWLGEDVPDDEFNQGILTSIIMQLGTGGINMIAEFVIVMQKVVEDTVEDRREVGFAARSAGDAVQAPAAAAAG